MDEPDTSRAAPRLVADTRPARGADAAVRSHERVGLTGVLRALDRLATPAFTPGRSVVHAVAWERDDHRSERWWPQGVTSVSESRLPGAPAPDLPPLLVSTAYAKRVRGMEHGCRITVSDLSDPERVRYGHVLLVRASPGPWDGATLQPLRAHAGGVVWHGGWLYVAATRRVLAFRVEDVVRAPGGGVLGHRFALPLRAEWSPPAGDRSRMRYSFLSLARTEDDAAAWLLAGEYDPKGRARLVRFPLDAEGGLVVDVDGHAVSEVVANGVERMQGAVQLPDGRLAISASDGRYRCGHLWAGEPGRLERRRGALPVGPEALTWWPERGELWTVSEYPGSRVAAAVAPPW